MKFTEHVKIREEKFGTVVFETLRERVFVTNEQGKDVLNLLKKGLSLEEATDALSRTYSGDKTRIKEDVTSFINQLRENNIIDG